MILNCITTNKNAMNSSMQRQQYQELNYDCSSSGYSFSDNNKTKLLTPSLVRSNSNASSNSFNDSMLTQIERTIKENLKQFENARKYCAYCGVKEQLSKNNELQRNYNDNSYDGSLSKTNKKILLGRCYGCQMVYYCSQNHQHLDWLENHMPKCAELEWVALGELIQSIPANPALTAQGMYWPSDCLNYGHKIKTWADWFEIRPDIVRIAHQTARILEKNFFSKANMIFSTNQSNRKEPSFNDLVDGLLASVTDSMTYSLSIGNSLIKLNIDPSKKPICIHLLNPPNDLLDDLIQLNKANRCDNLLEQSEIDKTAKKRFYELCNMFPSNNGFEIVLIFSSTIADENNKTGVDWCKMLQSPFMRTNFQKSLPANQKNLFISAWTGNYSNYIRYVCRIEDYAQPDLVVSFHPDFASCPQKLITDWTDNLKVILMNNYPCLFTFYDKDEKQKAFKSLNAFQTNIICLESNQFSSLLLKQMPSRPNHVYAANSFLMLLRGFSNVISSSFSSVSNTNENLNSRKYGNQMITSKFF